MENGKEYWPGKVVVPVNKEHVNVEKVSNHVL